MPDFDEAGHMHAIGGVNKFCHARNLFRFVANAFQISDRFNDCHDHSQITGCRLPPRNDLAADFVYGHFHCIDAMIIGDDIFNQAFVARDKRFNGFFDLTFHEPAHVQHACTNRLEVSVKLFGYVLATCHRTSANGSEPGNNT
jgi:hypothetical protein